MEDTRRSFEETASETMLDVWLYVNDGEITEIGQVQLAG